MGKHIRMTALLLAVSLFLNMVVLPVHAEETAAPTEQTVTDTELPAQEELLALEESAPESAEESVPETTAETVPETTAETVPETTTETEAEGLLEETELTEAESLLLGSAAFGTAMPLTGEGEVSALNTSYPLTLSDVFAERYTEGSQKLSINSNVDLILLSQVDPKDYKSLNLEFAINVSGGYDTTGKATCNGVDYTFRGLGSNAEPYQGTVTIIQATENTPIKLSQPLFNALSDSATIGDETYGVLLEYFPPDGTTPSALLAEQVHSGSVGTANQWYIRTVAASGTTAPPIIGTIQSGAKVSLNVNNSESSNSYAPIQAVEGSTNAGFLCAEMEANSSLTLNSWTLADGASLPAVTANGGDAGSLVGKMASGASLTVNQTVTTREGEEQTPQTVPLPISNVTASGSAGGLVGSAVDAAISLTSLTGSAVTIEGINAGGLIGSYTYSGGVAGAVNTVSMDIDEITVNGSNAGGVFGVLNNTGTGEFTIDSAIVSTTLVTGSESGNAGGLIGKYSATNLAAALNLQPVTVTSDLTGTASTYGGLIGWVSGNSAAYIEICGKTAEGAATPAQITVQAKGTANYYGGLIGSLTDAGHMVKTGSVNVTKSGTIKGNTAAGGLVGNMPSGVLCLDGTVSAATPEGDQSNRGGILGKNGNTLVYATASGAAGWPYYNSSSCNAIGNWGQVLRADKLPGLFTEETHQVTVSDLTDNTISSVTDFAAAVLRFQLNTMGALQFVGSDSAPTSLTVAQSVNLSDTGLTGFQRDYSSAENVNVTLTGSENISITLPNIIVYPTGSSHNRQGLFAKTTGLTVSNLTLKDGRNETNQTACGIRVSTYANDTYAGALVAESSGTVSLTNVKSYVNITKTGNNANERISGLIAYQNGGSVTFSGCAWDSYLKYNGSNACYMGGFLARTNEAVQINVNNCTISGSIEKTGGDTNYSGGLIGSLIDKKDADWNSNLVISGLTADGVTITSPNTATTTGGILGWEWMTNTTQISGVTVKNCTLNAPNARFGGLVYKGSGYWKVDGTGIAFALDTKANRFDGKSTNSETSGLLLAAGDRQNPNVHRNALYLEIHDDAYTIDPRSVTLPEGLTYFDEIVGVTEGANGNGIVSIATSNDRIDQTTENNVTVRNTYEKQLTADYKNGNTRYYYNLDTFRTNAGATDTVSPSGEINDEERMVLFSAYSHCYSDLQKYFYADNPGSITGNLDLTGYSYYPAEKFTTVKNATIKFDFEGIEEREADNKKPSESDRQHYGMHTGIFVGVTGTTGSLTVNDLTLQGTVGGVDGNYGALIRDVASGQNANHLLELTIGPVVLGGIRVVGNSDVKPLLINKLDSFTKLNIHDVSVKDSAYDKGNKAASSLIGDVGNSASGRDIQLVFSNMLLDGTASGSIFSRATFLESFQYANAGCSGVYNFTKPTDDSTPYTLGQELSNTTNGTVSGRNNGKQYWFYDSDHISENYVCGKDNNPAEFYANNKYLRYVYQKEGSQENYHEININLKAEELDGCGTYSDPYIIKGDDGGALLKQFADVITNDGASNQVMTIRMDPNVLGKTFSAESPKNGDAHPCVEYTCTNGTWSTNANGYTAPSKQAVLDYLCNAYYKVVGEITTADEWVGLGTQAHPFSGVIVGENGATVTISNTGTPSQYGGLILFSQGSVVKDLTIVYERTPSVSTDTTNYNIPTEKSNASFFGGVVGWCLGGDTILDTVEVTCPGVTINGTTNPHLTAVGGYVGMVGGAMIDGKVQYGGGVVFRGDSFPQPSIGTNEESTSFYVNPYVGRVLDGYVMSERASLDNTNKNYQIRKISEGKTLTRATVDGKDTVTVTDADDLWLLSAIANSGAGSIQDGNCWAYTKGKARTGTYLNIGDTMPDEDKADELYLGGTENKKSTSYLTAKYTIGDFYNLCSSGVSIVLNSDCDMSGYGNGFRGIGTSYATPANGNSNYRLIQVSSVNGNNHTVTLAQNRKEYTEEKNNWTSIGSGLFVLLRVPSTGFTASNLNLSGKTGITYYEGTSIATANTTALSTTNKRNTDTDKRLSLVGVGMLVGNLAKVDNNSQITLDSVHLLGTKDEKVTVNVNDDGSMGTTFAGGLAGYLWINNKSITKLTLRDCTYEYLSVRGRIEAGGFMGYTTAQEVSIEYTGDAELKDGTVNTTLNKCTQYDGVGGLIGEVNNGKLDINAAGISSLTVRDLSVSASVNGTENNVGGLIGVLRAADAKACTLKNIRMEGEIKLAGSLTTSSNVKSNVGLIAGGILDKDNDWEKAETSSYNFEVSNLHVAQQNGSSVKLYRGWQIGGLIGLYRTGNKTGYGTLKLDDIHFGSKESMISILNGTNIDGSHNCAASCLVATSCLVPQVEVTDVQIVNTKILSRKFGAFLYARIDNKSTATQTIDFKNISIENSTVAVSNGPSDKTSDSSETYYGTGALYGSIDNKGATITGCNILFRDCQIGFHVANDGSGKLAGITNDMPQTLNVGLSNSTATQQNTSYLCYDSIEESERSNYTRGNIAIFGGSLANATNKSVKLVGVSIQQSSNTLPMKDFGTNPGSYYVIRADYTGAANGEASKVTTSPAGHLTIGATTITGDGASFVDHSKTPVGSKIWDDVKPRTDSAGADIPPTDLNLKHYSQIRKSLDFLNGLSNGVVEFSSFQAAGDNKYAAGQGPEDFPVIVLQSSNNAEINYSIFSCISLLTNWEEYKDSSGKDIATTTGKTYYNLSLTSYKWNEASKTFEENVVDPSLYLTDTGKIFLKPGKYDNQKGQFNLIHVAYKDPADESKTAYDLYIPVVVKKVFEFKFWAAAKLGTDYTDSGYPLTGEKALNNAVIGSHGQKVTALLTYEYQWKKADWETAINSGQNLLWNFQHQVDLNNGIGLPSGTKLTLVDLEQEDKAFFWKTTETNIISFGNFKDDSDQNWRPVDLCDLLNLKATPDENGIYVLTGENEDGKDSTSATIRAEGLYYRPAEETDADKKHYTINVGLGETEKVTEQFYLTIQTPEGATDMVNADLESPNPLVNPTTNGGLPTKAVKAKDDRTDGYMFAWNGSENKLILGSFFDQNLTVTTTRGADQELITANDSKIDITLETGISIKEDAQALYRIYASDQRLYHCFELKANQYDDQNQKSSAMIAAGTEITVQFYKGEEKVDQKVHYYVDGPTPSYRLYFPYEIPATDVENGLTLRAEVSLNYSAAAILEQFPTRTNETERAGIAIAATSNLAYNDDSLQSSPIRSEEKEAQDNNQTVPHYYRNQEGAATLYYCAYEDQDGSWAEGVSELGINGLDGNSFAIHTAAAYNVSALPDAASATKLLCTVQLQQQTETSSYASPSYVSVDNLSSYLTQLTVSAGTNGMVPNNQQNALSGTVEFSIEGFNPDIPIEIPIDLVVRTGSDFEGKNLTYANYRVLLTVELLNDEGEINFSEAKDYIVYTNAKIYRGLIGSPTG